MMSWIFLRERIAPRTLFGIATLAVGGIVMVALDSHGGGEHLGDTFAWARCCWSADVLRGHYVVIGKRLTPTCHRRISALINLAGLVLVTPLGPMAGRRFRLRHRRREGLGTAALLRDRRQHRHGLVWMKGLQHVSAAKAGVFMVFLPISTALVGLVLLGEQMSGIQLLAYALALGGVVLATWPGRPRLDDGRRAPLAGSPGRAAGEVADDPDRPAPGIHRSSSSFTTNVIPFADSAR